jgi:excisionase family DNA binding protein
MTEDEKPLKIREAADRLGVDYGTIRGAIEQGLLPAIRQDEALRVLPSDLIAYRERIAIRPPEPKVESPTPEPPASQELDEAREFAARARRWVRRPAVGRPRPKDEDRTEEG